MSVLNASRRVTRATENQWPKIAARLRMKLPGEKARITMVVTAAGETSWSREAGARQFWTAMGELHGFDWTTAGPCEGMRVALCRATPTEAA
ncbi:hypothetical protein M3I53_36450 [Paraburkholderia sp. CNPSo 3272]|uniref:hypothetical protein n=2 Tax=unclassified Paraburkholderia TaxID=2615204 RepID=UPI0020B8ECA0|nr:hypothetical protein [Paraburkholderia sp. CNPSo 3272]MCP3728525.1 hypothetical protein [Paraburkholderia sp. CNPSo 3272]